MKNKKAKKWPLVSDKEIDAIKEVLFEKKWGGIFGDSECQKFEKRLSKLFDVKYCITVSNGTMALLLALMALGIKKDDEVIVPALSYIATASVINMLGAIPVFVDIDPYSTNIDVNKIQDVISERTKAIIAVHLWGIPCNIKKIVQIAKNNKLYVVEDCCQAFGSAVGDKYVGTFGDIGVFSFASTKNISCGEGGAIITDNSIYNDKICKYRNHGRVEGTEYYHKELGSNCRLSEIAGAILNVQLERLHMMIKTKKENYSYFTNKLDEYDLKWMQKLKQEENTISNYFGIVYIYHKELNKNISIEDIVFYMQKRGIPAGNRKILPLYRNPMYTSGKCRYRKGKIDIADNIELIILGQPLGYSILLSDKDYIDNVLLEIKKINIKACK